MIKTAIRKLLRRHGFAIDFVGPPSAISGKDILQDVRAVLGGPASASVLFDVGANVGLTVTEMQVVFPQARIYAFEPNPRTFAELESRHGGSATLENLAVGSAAGRLTLHATPYSTNDSLLAPAWKNAQSEKVEVDVVTLDDYCARHDIAAIDLVKIDTQGFDLEVLRGAERLLSGRRIKAFSAELIFPIAYHGQPTYLDILSFGAGHGYEPLGFYHQTHRNNSLEYCDVCFIARR